MALLGTALDPDLLPELSLKRTPLGRLQNSCLPPAWTDHIPVMALGRGFVRGR